MNASNLATLLGADISETVESVGSVWIMGDGHIAYQPYGLGVQMFLTVDRFASAFVGHFAETERPDDVGVVVATGEPVEPVVTISALRDWIASASLRDHVAAVLCEIAEAIGTQAAPGGGGLTCSESDALVGLYRAVGLADFADDLAESHAWSDTDDTDAHHDRYVELHAGSDAL